MRFLPILSCLCISYPVFGADLGKRLNFTVGTDLYQPQYKEQRYEFDDYSVLKNPLHSLSKVSLGLSYRLLQNHPLYIGVRSNRLINNPSTMNAVDTVLNQNVSIYQKVITDSIYLTTYVHKKIAPLIVATNLESETVFIYDNGKSFTNNNTAILYGCGIVFSINKRNALAVLYFLPNDKINTKRVIGFSYSYIFASLL